MNGRFALAVWFVVQSSSGVGAQMLEPFTILGGAGGSASEHAQVPLVFVLHGDAAGDGPVELVLLTQGGTVAWPWQLHAKRSVLVSNGVLRLSGPAGRLVILVLWRPGMAGYFMHGPFHWPTDPGTTVLDLPRRRTIRGRVPGGVDGRAIHWLEAVPPGQTETTCVALGTSSFECVGIPWSARGVVLIERGPEQLMAGVVSTPPEHTVEWVPLTRTRWGRLVHVGWPRGQALGQLQSTVWRSMPGSANSRVRRVRVVAEPGFGVVWLTDTSFWVAGNLPADDVFVQVEGPNLVTTRIDIGTYQGGSPLVPVDVPLRPAAKAAGVVQGFDGRPARGARLVVSELVRAAGAFQRTDVSDEARRRIAEVACDDAGAFVVDGLELQEYEWVALHPLLGRATVVRRPDGQMVLTLDPGRTASGRIVTRGYPASGVPIAVVPRLSRLEEGMDPLDQIGFESQSEADGRFQVSVPKAGGELRLGSNETGIVRIPFNAFGGRGRVELGDVELAGPIRLGVLVDGVTGCELFAAGPFGSAAMQIIAAADEPTGIRTLILPEPGLWTMNLMCGAREVPVVPAAVQVTRETDHQTVTLAAIPP